MPRIARETRVGWEGNVARGVGAISAMSSGAFSGLAYTAATRVGIPEGKTSPEELLAAAHAGCFAMSLAAELSKAGTPPESLDVRCILTVDEVEGVGHHLVVHSEIGAHGVFLPVTRPLSPRWSRPPMRAARSRCSSARVRRSRSRRP